MKGKKTTRQQKKIIKESKLNTSNWLVIKNPTNQLYIQHRENNKIRILNF